VTVTWADNRKRPRRVARKVAARFGARRYADEVPAALLAGAAEIARLCALNRWPIKPGGYVARFKHEVDELHEMIAHDLANRRAHRHAFLAAPKREAKP
jgi:hypothetical protein